MTAGPIFVAGLERSGTSLMYALLASHPKISMTRRTNFWRYFADQYGDLNDDANLDECLETLRVYKRFVVLDLDFEGIRAEFITGPRTYGRLYELVQLQIARRLDKPRWGDKSLNTERYADRLVAEYPDVRILHMMRDPRDRLASVLKRWKHRRADVGAGTAAWLWSARLARFNQEHYPDNYRIVRYESLVQDPTREVGAICDFLEEDFTEEMLTMSGAGRFRDEGANSSYGARPVGVIGTDSIRRFDEVLNPRQLAYMHAVASEEMEAHGYEPTPVLLDSVERLRLTLVDRPVNRSLSVAWFARERVRSLRGRRLPEYRMVPEAAR